MNKDNPVSVDSVVVSRATASLAASAELDLGKEDKDIRDLIKEEQTQK